MNRREFLLAVGTTACSGRGRVEPLEVPVPTDKPPASKPPIISAVPSVTNTNLAASPLAIHGNLLVQEVDDELWQWDLSTMRQINAFVLPHDAFTLLADGSMVAFGRREHASDCAFHRFASGVLTTYSTWLCGTAREPLLLHTGSTDSIYSVRDKEILRFRFDGSTVEADATIAIPIMSYSNRGQMFSLGDGRIVAPGDGISILAPDTAPVRRAMGKVFPRHLARATRERFWYSHASSASNVFDRLVLAHLGDPLRGARVVTFAPSRIVHVASHGSAIALLLMSRAGDHESWHVAVVEESGAERWRAEVPQQTHAYTRNYGAVALSDTRLVLHTPSDALLAWDAATGATVAVTPPA